MTKSTMTMLRAVPILLGAAGVAGCDFEVNNPGRILEEDLNVGQAVQALVTGMSADFSVQYDNVAFAIARASDEMAGSGSYNQTNDFRRGIMLAEDVDGIWEGMQRARWVAEDGLRRMRDDIEDFTFDGSPLTARGYLFAGMASRVIGETFCYGVVSATAELGAGNGPAVESSESFQRALNMLQEALNHATTAGNQELIDAAHGGRAQAFVGLGDWTNAVAEAGLVATDFQYDAIYSDNTGRESNVVYDETHGRPEMSVFDTYAASFSPPDPRAPYNECPTTGDCPDAGADGITIFFRQEKYPDDGSEIAMVKGTEMRLIEAEAALRSGDLATAIARMNEVRAFTGVGSDLTPAPSTIDEAFIALDRERELTLWLEGRRMYDARRWDAEGRSTLPSVQFLNGETFIAGDEMDPTLTQRVSCVPVSFSECLSNRNLDGSPACS